MSFCILMELRHTQWRSKEYSMTMWCTKRRRWQWMASRSGWIQSTPKCGRTNCQMARLWKSRLVLRSLTDSGDTCVLIWNMHPGRWVPLPWPAKSELPSGHTGTGPRICGQPLGTCWKSCVLEILVAAACKRWKKQSLQSYGIEKWQGFKFHGPLHVSAGLAGLPI